MNKGVLEYLIKHNIDLEDYIIEKESCDNITLKHKTNGKLIDIRW